MGSGHESRQFLKLFKRQHTSTLAHSSASPPAYLRESRVALPQASMLIASKSNMPRVTYSARSRIKVVVSRTFQVSTMFVGLETKQRIVRCVTSAVPLRRWLAPFPPFQAMFDVP